MTEVPFAGHPNVGTAFVLAGMGELFGQVLSDQLIFEEKAGLIEVSVQRAGHGHHPRAWPADGRRQYCG